MIENYRYQFKDGIDDVLNTSKIISEGNLSPTELSHLKKVKQEWDFYEGYHWEGIDDLDSAQVTFNYCRAFVNKFVAFELGKGFSIKTAPEMDGVSVTIDDTVLKATIDSNDNGVIEKEDIDRNKVTYEVTEKTEQEYLSGVWNSNNREILLEEIGQTKSITGDAWIKVQYVSQEEMTDPFNEYPNGKIRLSVVPTQYIYPQWDDHDKDKLVSILIMYPIRADKETGILFWRRTVNSTVLYKELWTENEITVYRDNIKVETYENPYGFIPFVQIKNYPIAGRSYGMSDLEDVIPLNVEYNTKKSDVSEVIDYHSAPITLVYGAKIGNLEKGANKVWGGLPKDSKVENLSLQGDLIAASHYIEGVKSAMCEIVGIPESVLGKSLAISNTSGVALQYLNLPLIEKTRLKRACTALGLQKVNKIILFLSLYHGLIEKPEDISMKDFVYNVVSIPDTLPKDELVELQKIQQEMMLGIECRHGAMERLGKVDIGKKLNEIDQERMEHPEVFNPNLQGDWYQNTFMTPTNAGGMMNSNTPTEELRKEMFGKNEPTNLT